MEMEVVAVPAPAEFNFDSNCSSPYITAPSSPQRFGGPSFFFSAPTSPARISSFLDHHSPPPQHATDDDRHDFEFNFSGHLDRPSLSADELFDGGKIRPLKPPPRLQSGDGPTLAAAIEEEEEEEEEEPQRQKRGRERAPFPGRKGSRSLSPLRVSDVIVCDSAEERGGEVPSSASNVEGKSSFLSSISFTRGYRKWRLRDLLLFRSASEGRATDKDPLRTKYEALSKKTDQDDLRNCSFRSTESSGSVSRRRGPLSAHELHYTVNRAASEELKKRTFLPYRRGLLGCLGFNPRGTSIHHISRGIGSFSRS